MFKYCQYIDSHDECIGYSVSKNMDASMKKNINIAMLESNSENIDTIINLDKYVKFNYTNFFIKEPYVKIIKNYIFFKNYDFLGNDIHYNNKMTLNQMIEYADSNENCYGFNTLGFFKNNINVSELVKNQYINYGENGLFVKINKISTIKIKNMNTLDEDFKNSDDSIALHSLGFYKKNLDLFNPIIENEIYDNFLEINIPKLYENKLNIKKNSGKIRIKIICDSLDSKELCNIINKMSMGMLNWNNLEFTCYDDFIDYYVIVNNIYKDTFFVPEKTIYFFTDNCKKNISNDYLFMHIEHLNLFIWNLNNNYMDLKYNIISKKYDLYKSDNHMFEYKYVKIINYSECIPQIVYDAFLSECLILYYGSKTILKYFNNDSIIFLDKEEDTPELNMNDLWKLNIDNIKKEKIKILDDMNIFNKIEKIISLHTL